MSFRKIQTSNIDTSEAAFSDPILILGKDNVGASDIGFLGKIGVLSQVIKLKQYK